MTANDDANTAADVRGVGRAPEDCGCVCHGGPGSFPPPCSVPGGCGPHEARSRCLRVSDCEQPEVLEVAGGRQTVGGLADRALCGACESATRAALRAAPGLYVDLRNKALDRATASPFSTRVVRSRSGSFGLNATPLHLTESLHWLVTGWADAVLDVADRPAIDRQSQLEGGQVQDACLILARYLTTWIGHEHAEFAVTRWDADPDDPKAQPTSREVTIVQAGWEACGWLIGWRQAAERILHIPVLVHYPPEPCPACNQERVLKRVDGDDKVSCMGCGKAWTLAMYETFVHAWIGGAA